MTGIHRDEGWTIVRGASPIVGTAIHDGGDVRPECEALMALDAGQRQREEDPFTAELIANFPTRIVAHRSRFEVDLNRARDAAIYLKPEQSWGLRVWREPPDEAIVARSLAFHTAFYEALHSTLSEIARRHGKFVVIDVHSYNHRRDGPDAAPTPVAQAPDINIGTSSMDRDRWAPVVDRFLEALAKGRLAGRPLAVGENVSFQGRGEQTRFIHERFPETGCAIAVEFKKIFMDEWTGRPDRSAVAELRHLLASTIPLLEDALKAMR